ncbi:hypothetical protein MTP09_06745 [Chryseobacterium suipulveris]|uniref:Lipocalin-like domain-containing protein n=1 Tax=Chryseobacterium suipulveris TaxID=2929800 RepID=A0ABY4BT10_9FLAO|nr:hypothetical protein [Chryseobacterium suipulveris]UOE42327.1 hypothetical protein MTP09_06745 [Chryseobacterium suipulveris]
MTATEKHINCFPKDVQEILRRIRTIFLEEVPDATKIIMVVGLFIFTSCQKTEAVKEQNTEPTRTEESLPPVQKPTTYKQFSGAWFDIEYPSNFKAENSQKSSTNSEGFDSAVFTSPDGKVQFYVFSPQWSGNPLDIKVTSCEKIIETSQQKENDIFVKRWTVAADDGTYFRSYEETAETLSNINKVFGIKYASKADLEKYREEYLHFKKSLKQYAD